MDTAVSLSVSEVRIHLLLPQLTSFLHTFLSHHFLPFSHLFVYLSFSVSSLCGSLYPPSHSLSASLSLFPLYISLPFQSLSTASLSLSLSLQLYCYNDSSSQAPVRSAVLLPRSAALCLKHWNKRGKTWKSPLTPQNPSPLPPCHSGVGREGETFQITGGDDRRFSKP